MWPFRRRAAAPPALTNEAYSAWLRAWQPPLQWFLSLSEIEQEQLATLGDQRAADLAAQNETLKKYNFKYQKE